jgi:hypothetical protein
MPNEEAQSEPVQTGDLVDLVTAPVLRQINQNTAAVLEVLAEIRELVEAIGRQIKRQIPDRGSS